MNDWLTSDNRSSPKIGRRTLLSAFASASLVVASGCSAAQRTGEILDLDLDFRDPAPARGSANNARPTGPYSVAAPRRVNYHPLSGPITASNFGDLHVPENTPGRLPVLVMIHGGGWVEPSGLDYMTPLARDIASHGAAVWNIEYRRVGGGGGWPNTLTDTSAAVDFVAALPSITGLPLDVTDVHVTGHSAGGHLAGWVPSRHTMPDGAPGASPLIRVRTAVTMAGVFDLALADDHGQDRFVRGLLGGSDDQRSERYQLASPIEHLPTGIPITCVHGSADRVVLPEQSRNYVVKATGGGDPATLVMVPGMGHTQFADPSSPSWQRTREQLLTNLQR